MKKEDGFLLRKKMYNFLHKIKTREECEKISRAFQKSKQKIGFTSGAYDMIHSGHVAFLDKAKQECDILIVGVNTDQSIKQYKDTKKPIIPEQSRIFTLAGLDSVDYTFLFNELNNKINIKCILPNYYIKGPDYLNKAMTSKPLVESYGGEVKLVDHDQKSISTSTIITDITTKYTNQCCNDKHKYKGLVLIDRDGVINKEVNYLSLANEFELEESVIEGIRALNKKNYAVAIITNQPGIDLGLFTDKKLLNIHKELIQVLHKNKVFIDRIFFSPNSHKESKYKKPNGGMIEEALEYFKDINENIYMIGDRKSDSLAAKTANERIKTIGVQTGYGLNDYWTNHNPERIAENLGQACIMILQDQES